MTDADVKAYQQLVRRVAAGRGKPASDEQLDGLWLLVRELEFSTFERAFVQAAKETRFFPTAADIHTKAKQFAQEQAQNFIRPEVARAIADGEICCTVCDDTGWAPTTINATRVYGEQVVEVVGGGRVRRTVVPGDVPEIVAETEPPYVRGRFDPAAVPAVRVCGCRASNPVWQARRAMTRRVGAREEA